jgi:hypothetical protein
MAIFFNLEFYPPQEFADGDSQNQPVNVNYDDDDSYKMLLRLLEFFQTFEQEKKAKDDGNKYF